MKLLLTKDEIEKTYREGVRAAWSESEVRAARTWRIIQLRHPWRGFFMDVLMGIAMCGAAMIASPRRMRF